jgi:aminopeptidase N
MRRPPWLSPLALVLVALVAGPALAQAPAASRPAASSTAEPLRTAGDRPVDIEHIRLDLRVDLPHKTAEGTATLRLHALRDVKHVKLDAAGFEVKKVTLARGDGQAAPAQFTHDGKKLVVDLAPAWATGQIGTLRVEYRVHDPRDGLHFYGPSKADPDAPLIVWSQGESVSNHYWFPCLDQPDQRQSTELVVTVERGFEVVSNGKLLSREDNPDGKTVTFHWLQKEPHAAYLVTLVVGQFDVVREEWDKVPVLYYVPKGQKDMVAHTFSRTREMLEFFSQRFGVRYPWEKYAQVVAYQFGGGMENTSATTMGDILRDQRSLLDGDSDSIISHELAHQWWGDLLTCRDWAHIWLNEGFASYAECLWDEHLGGADAYQYNLFRKSGGAISGGKDRPIVDRHYRSPDSMFDSRAYPKGAWVLHMLRRRLGDDAFWRGIRRYGNEHRLQSVETSDLRRTLERESGRDLDHFFYDWTERPGSPVLNVTTEYQPEAKQARVVVKQTQAGEPFHFPLSVVLNCASGQPVTIEQEVTDKEYTFVVPVPGRLTRVDVDPDYTLLGEVNETKDRGLWQAQLLEAPGVAARIRAARHFAKSKTDADRQLLARAFAGEKFWGVRVELAAALGDASGNASRDALLGGLRQPDARVRRACVSALEKFKDDAKVVEAVKGILKSGDPSYQVEGAALALYARQGQKDAVATIRPWLSKPSRQDTLRGAALRALGSTADPSALDTLLEWSRPGHPATARSAAVQGLSQVIRKGKPTDAQRRQVMQTFTDALDSDSQRMRFTALVTLREMGTAAKDALPAVEKLSRDDPQERVRELAKQTAEQIRAKPANASAPELTKLREEVDRLKREQEALRERLNKFEKSAKKP